ncbi:NAD-dependent protein deacetylase hst4 [Penicillium chermesinum]|nr:NAD-dependent protein deacetylase hst4 [Penicillium chermesinum]
MDSETLSDVSDLSSVPSSREASPSLESAVRYPTPSSQDEDSTRQDFSLCPLAAQKRRRNPLPKERTTQYLDLAKSSYTQKAETELLVKTIRHQKDIVVIAGAGISTSAGIPDFRSADGLFKSLPKKYNLKASGKLLFDAAVYQDENLMAPFHELVRSLHSESAKTQPTKFHNMLARLGKENRLKRLYTQNIDGIETSMKPLETEIPLSNVKGQWPVTIQLHGSIQKMICQKCRTVCDLIPEKFLADPPECQQCSEVDETRQTIGQRSHGVGRMRPRIVLYNEYNPDEEAITSVMNADVKSRPRVLIVAGTSLKIPGVRRLVKTLCPIIRVGKEFEDCFDLIVQGSTDQVADLVQLKDWEDSAPYTAPLPEPEFGPRPENETSDLEQGKSGENVAVVIHTPKKRPRSDTGLLTPSSRDGSSMEPPSKTTKIANPASRGRQLADVLGNKKPKAASVKGRKKAPAATIKKPKGKAAPTTAPAAKITNFTKVTKASKAPVSSGKKAAPSKTMHLVTATRKNVMFPGLVKKAGVSEMDSIDPASLPDSLPLVAPSS